MQIDELDLVAIRLNFLTKLKELSAAFQQGQKVEGGKMLYILSTYRMLFFEHGIPNETQPLNFDQIFIFDPALQTGNINDEGFSTVLVNSNQQMGQVKDKIRKSIDKVIEMNLEMKFNGRLTLEQYKIIVQNLNIAFEQLKNEYGIKPKKGMVFKLGDKKRTIKSVDALLTAHILNILKDSVGFSEESTSISTLKEILTEGLLIV